jgi:hypothetical protein
MMNRKFNKYYKDNFESLGAASRKLGFSRSAICLWLNGKATPHRITMQAIARKTKNKVTTASWFA